jgi:hypothetical protein
MTPRADDDRVLVGLAVLAAFAAGLVAVAQHASCTSAGYQLAVAQRECVELRRSLAQAERGVTRLETLPAASSRATPMKLASLRYPKTWNVVSSATLRSLASAQTTTLLPTTAAAARGTSR